jgi:hypothetical protein
MVGDGTAANPRRPMFAPVPPSLQQLQAQTATAAPTGPTGEPAAPARSGILAFQYQVSDDGNFAFVEFVGADQQALSAILKSVDPNVKAFERSASKKLDIENAFQKYKKNFTLDNYVPVGIYWLLAGAVIPWMIWDRGPLEQFRLTNSIETWAFLAFSCLTLVEVIIHLAIASPELRQLFRLNDFLDLHSDAASRFQSSRFVLLYLTSSASVIVFPLFVDSLRECAPGNHASKKPRS